MRGNRAHRILRVLGPGAVALALVVGIATASPAVASRSKITVVAAENTWGSLATQLGGSKADVVSVVSNPNADPHEYETNPTDARDVAQAQLVIVNGAGYDEWADRLLAAQPESRRTVLDVASLLGKKDGDNPHFWYGPSYVFRVIDKITVDYQRIDPSDRSYFAAQKAAVERAFAPYRAELASITARFVGARVAATESIFQYMAQYLRLDLVTPYSFMQAVAEGNDPPAQSEATFYRQISHKSFGVLVFNTQTVTPLTTAIKTAARSQQLVVIGVSETLEPVHATFEAWMTTELRRLATALAATGSS